MSFKELESLKNRVIIKINALKYNKEKENDLLYSDSDIEEILRSCLKLQLDFFV